MNTVQLLRKAKKLIEKPDHWSVGANFRDKDGNVLKKPYLFTPEVDEFIENAYAFSIWGAIEYIDFTHKGTYKAMEEAICIICRQVPQHYGASTDTLPHEYNDFASHNSIIRLLDYCGYQAEYNQMHGIRYVL